MDRGSRWNMGGGRREQAFMVEDNLVHANSGHCQTFLNIWYTNMCGSGSGSTWDTLSPAIGTGAACHATCIDHSIHAIHHWTSRSFMNRLKYKTKPC